MNASAEIPCASCLELPAPKNFCFRKLWGFQRAKHVFRVRAGFFRFSPGASLPPWVGLPQGTLVRIPKPALFSGGRLVGSGSFCQIWSHSDPL